MSKWSSMCEIIALDFLKEYIKAPSDILLIIFRWQFNVI